MGCVCRLAVLTAWEVGHSNLVSRPIEMMGFSHVIPAVQSESGGHVGITI